MTIQEIQAYLAEFFDSVELVGNGEVKISAPAKIESAGKGEVSFIANEKYLRFLGETKASLVIVHRSVNVEGFVEGRSFLKVTDPYTAFVFVLKKFSRPRIMAAQGIASTVAIGEGVVMGEGVAVGEYAVVGDRCRIGAGTQIEPQRWFCLQAQDDPQNRPVLLSCTADPWSHSLKFRPGRQ